MTIITALHDNYELGYIWMQKMSAGKQELEN